jgi:hypothetical protein
MQTFLPYPDFTRSARVLDDRRLGKQRVETLQIVRALHREKYGWKHHPAVLMWRGYDEALGAYGVAICQEWCRRGRADTCETQIVDELAAVGVPTPIRTQRELQAAGRLPPWLGNRRLHRSHQSSLLRKDPEWYAAHFGSVPDDLPYHWPVTKAML